MISRRLLAFLPVALIGNVVSAAPNLRSEMNTANEWLKESISNCFAIQADGKASRCSEYGIEYEEFYAIRTAESGAAQCAAKAAFDFIWSALKGNTSYAIIWRIRPEWDYHGSDENHPAQIKLYLRAHCLWRDEWTANAHLRDLGAPSLFWSAKRPLDIKC